MILVPIFRVLSIYSLALVGDLVKGRVSTSGSLHILESDKANPTTKAITSSNQSDVTDFSVSLKYLSECRDIWTWRKILHNQRDVW